MDHMPLNPILAFYSQSRSLPDFVTSFFISFSSSNIVLSRKEFFFSFKGKKIFLPLCVFFCSTILVLINHKKLILLKFPTRIYFNLLSERKKRHKILPDNFWREHPWLSYVGTEKEGHRIICLSCSHPMLTPFLKGVDFPIGPSGAVSHEREQLQNLVACHNS